MRLAAHTLKGSAIASTASAQTFVLPGGLFIGRAAWNAADFIGIVEAVIANLGETS